jgi:hypothetical protein
MQGFMPVGTICLQLLGSLLRGFDLLSADPSFNTMSTAAYTRLAGSRDDKEEDGFVLTKSPGKYRSLIAVSSRREFISS